MNLLLRLFFFDGRSNVFENEFSNREDNKDPLSHALLQFRSIDLQDTC